MKTIFLLRHAKSSWSEPGLDDRLRSLNKRGERDAPEMGRRFKLRGEPLDIILTSPALRARRTAELFAESCDYSSGVIVKASELYFADTGSGGLSVENLISRQDDEIMSLMLVFHNPDITRLANFIDTENFITNIPTCGIVKVTSNAMRWCDWPESEKRLLYYDYPKNPFLPNS